MLLKNYHKTGIVTWSNSKTNSHLLACAPNQEQGPFDLSILAFDLAQKNKQLAVLGTTASEKRFRCLAWDVFGQKSGNYLNGLIFGGMDDGGITLWDPSQIISSSKKSIHSNSVGLVYQEDPILDYPIMCAQWNALKPNLLGFGSTEVLVMDIGENLSEPNIFKISEKNPHAGSYITAVAWNKEVAHIMASASDNGLIALWDVKVNKSIFTFNDSPNGLSQKNVNIAWSKSVFAQIAVTLDEENKNQLQIWDLRNQKGPIVVIDKNHTRGINCMDWCDSDPELILASSKDNKVICWNYKREQPVIETTLSEPIYDIKWSKKLPSIYYVATQSKIEVYSIDDSNLYSYVPKWYKIPVGTCVGPNNNIISFDEKTASSLNEYNYQAKNDSLIPSIKNIDSFLKSPNISSYLQQRKASTQSSEREFWALMELMNTGGIDSDIYSYLGFDKDSIIKSAEQYTNKKYDSPTKRTNKNAKTNDYISYTGEDASKFFEVMMSNNFGSPAVQESFDHENVKYDMVPRNSNWDTGKQKIIKQNLLIGNYTGAIDAALKCGRGAEALVIAYSQGQDIFKSTLKTFFTETTDNFITGTLRYIAEKQLEDMVKKYPINQWKQCVSFIYSLVHDHRALHLKSLAQRLLHDADGIEEALICLALAQDFNELLTLFNKLISNMQAGTKRKIYLLNLVEKLLVIRKVTTKQINHSQLFDRFLLEASLILLEQGETHLAYQLIQLGNINDQKIVYTRYLIAQSHPNLRNKLPNPFKPFNIPIMQNKTKRNIQSQPQNIGKQPNTTQKQENIGRQTSKGIISRPPPLFNQEHKTEQKSSFNPHPAGGPTGGFNPNENNISNISVKQGMVSPPPANIRKPPPPKIFETPVNIPPQKQQQASFVPNNQSFNPMNSFNQNKGGFAPQTSSSHVNIPASSIPSISVRNKPPPPPPSKIKKQDSFQDQEKNIEQQKQPQNVYQTKMSSQSNSIRTIPQPPASNRVNHPPPPSMNNFQKQNEQQQFTSQNSNQSQQQFNQQSQQQFNQQHHISNVPVHQNQNQNQNKGYVNQPAQQVQQHGYQAPVMAPTQHVPIVAPKRPVPPPPRRN